MLIQKKNDIPCVKTRTQFKSTTHQNSWSNLACSPVCLIRRTRRSRGPPLRAVNCWKSVHTVSDTVVHSNASKAPRNQTMPQPSYVVCQPTEKISSPNSFKVSSQAGCFTNIHKQQSCKDWNVSTRARVVPSNNLTCVQKQTPGEQNSIIIITHDASAVIRGMPAHGESLVAKQLQGIITGRLLHKHSQATVMQRLECINKSTGGTV